MPKHDGGEKRGIKKTFSFDKWVSRNVLEGPPLVQSLTDIWARLPEALSNSLKMQPEAKIKKTLLKQNTNPDVLEVKATGSRPHAYFIWVGRDRWVKDRHPHDGVVVVFLRRLIKHSFPELPMVTGPHPREPLWASSAPRKFKGHGYADRGLRK